jgi:hypothetical protein
MRRILAPAVSACVSSVCCHCAFAHFLWIDWQPAVGGESQARLIFSDKPRPEGRDLTEKLRRAKVWSRSAGGQVTDVAVQRGTGADAKTLVAKLAGQNGACLEAAYDYGVYAHGSQNVLLHYYAKALPAGWEARGEPFVRSTRLELDVVPHWSGDVLGVKVLFHGKPAAQREVVLFTPSGEEREGKTGAGGETTFRPAASGRYFIRAGYVEADRGGKLDGKPFAQTWSYCTASFPAGAEAAAKSDAQTAAGLLAGARANRSVWPKGFPGFKADIAVTVDGEAKSGKLKIDSSGTVELVMPDGKPADWARDQLESMVQHRMPDGQVSEGNVVYVDDDRTNPLGRRIALDDDRESSYRIKDGVIREVRRADGATRFTISVLEVDWNPEKKYLPRSFAINYFDSKSGELRQSHAFHNGWRRLGGFDLPTLILEIAVERGSTSVRQVELKNLELLSK